LSSILRRWLWWAVNYFPSQKRRLAAQSATSKAITTIFIKFLQIL
jgi:hypothetical protein